MRQTTIPQAVRNRRAALAAVAKETKAALPSVVQQLPGLQPYMSSQHTLDDLGPLDPALCPRFPLSSGSNGDPQACGTTVKVVNADSFEAALEMPGKVPDQEPTNPLFLTATPTGTTAHDDDGKKKEDVDDDDETAQKTTQRRQRNHRVVVLNLASDKNPGGGWLNGSSAQEEALCYRSSLSLSLHRRYYPWAARSGLYTRDVVIIRRAQSQGHGLLVPRTPADQLPVVSVVSVAGIRRPEVVSGAGGSGLEERFARPRDRALTKDKMRLVLRIAAAQGHELLVLGAIGCGAFGNPPREVARCWLEVLEEAEFRGGWWREIWFAVFDARGEGNGSVFEEELGGKVVGKVVTGQ
ncbi:hypothetical protein JX265_008912 [Neoarthrinium moseri]|uniref:Microbial-type PARG catalytic domain-containing protein n=1 Tax=Neoarthrinium moseri TaxID=1658444 RepID=A0A9Q0ALX8_9PEZI|nr:uncharacterized protein JN550_007782 [Neoarthrinium moseri]KAI1862866.1 hypothetical protein JX265_008912 [Neoarthrinium moseri]KAI1866093.1 hypothetical protein JN550_007782 [Neoarthrinium moseri]